MDDPYQRRRGELQSLGDIITAAIRVSDPNFYRPDRPFRHAAKKKKQPKDDGKLRGVQLELFANLSSGSAGCSFLVLGEGSETVAASHCPDSSASSAITPDNPITDEDIPFIVADFSVLECPPKWNSRKYV